MPAEPAPPVRSTVPQTVAIRSESGRIPSARLPSVSRTLQVLAAVVVVVLIGLITQHIYELREKTLEAAAHQMSELDMVLGEQTGRAVETIDFILRGATENRGEADSDPRDTLRQMIMGVRQILAIDIADPTGMIVRSSRSSDETMLPREAMPLLLKAATTPKIGLQFSEPIHLADGSWTSLVIRRIDGPNLRFEGVAVAWLNLQYFEDFYRAVELIDNGAISLHRRDGVLLARYPHVETLEGRSFGDASPFRDVLSHAIAGTTTMVSPQDGSTRILATRALRTAPLAVNISVDQDVVLAPWRREALTLALTGLVAALLLGALLLQVARRSRDTEAVLSKQHLVHREMEAAHNDLVDQMHKRESAETALRQAQRVEAVGQLTGGVAHDFNNLLTVLLGNIDLLQSQPEASAFGPRLSTMRAAAERGAALIGQLLAFARRQPVLPRAVNLGALVADLLPLLQSAVGSQVTINIEVDPRTPAALVDPTQIELVILNLAINARDAMPQGGTLSIDLRKLTRAASLKADGLPAGEYVGLRVTDTGTGMTPDVLAQAFVPYFTTKPAGSGSGLGLSQVAAIARQFGGLARIDSSPDSGTCVEILLPLVQSSETMTEQQTGSPMMTPTVSGRANVLVVDDDVDVRSTTALLLRRMGYGVTTAGSAAEALNLLDTNQDIELLLSDVVMPQVTGPDLARQARAKHPDLPVVFFSGYADPEAIAGAIPLARLLRKPFRPTELAKLIETALAEARTAPTHSNATV